MISGPDHVLRAQKEALKFWHSSLVQAVRLFIVQYRRVQAENPSVSVGVAFKLAF